MLISRISSVSSIPWHWAVQNVSPAVYFGCSELHTLLGLLPSYIHRKEIHRCKTTDSHKQAASLTEARDNEQNQLTLSARVKQTATDVSYIGVIIAGIGVTGVMFYAILRELFSGHSPNSIYSQAYKLCKKDERVADAVGLPIKGYGEETARGRRRHVSYVEYTKDGVNYMRMKFYIEGSRRKGIVHLEMKENDKKKYEYRYLIVELDGYPTKTIVLEDNTEPQNDMLTI